jgi:hypothetical protein
MLRGGLKTRLSTVRLNFGKLSYRADSERSTERSRRSLVELHGEAFLLASQTLN